MSTGTGSEGHHVLSVLVKQGTGMSRTACRQDIQAA